MNAILRKCEAVVLTNEAIEVHLSYLRPAVDRLDEKVDKLSDRLDQTNDRISKVQGSIDGLKWFIASIALILSGLSIARTFGWI